MKQYKFRGRNIKNGEYVYAELGQISEELDSGYITFITDDVYTIAEDSIEQFIGFYDKNGNEIYENDIVVIEYNGSRYEYKAHLKGFATTDDGCYITGELFKGVTKPQAVVSKPQAV